MNTQLNELIESLLLNRAQFHIWHLQTRSYAEHKALEFIYEMLSSHADSLAESIQDNERLSISGNTFDLLDYESAAECSSRVDELIESVQDDCAACAGIKGDYIANQLQELLRDLHKGKYLLSLK